MPKPPYTLNLCFVGSHDVTVSSGTTFLKGPKLTETLAESIATSSLTNER